MRYLILATLLAGCATTDRHPGDMSTAAKMACGFGHGDVYRDEHGQERCRHRPTTKCTSRRVGDEVETECS